MPLFPSLEDMHVHKVMEEQAAQLAQARAEAALIFSSGQGGEHPPRVGIPVGPSAPLYALLPTIVETPPGSFSGSLEDQENASVVSHRDQVAVSRLLYCGSPVPANAVENERPALPSAFDHLVAPLSGSSVGLIRAHVSHWVREVRLCKNAKGRIGLRVKAVNGGVFVQLVERDSPAALAGLRFGDQILQIDGETVSGYSMDRAHAIFRNCPANGIRLAVRDRPFERTVTLHKSSGGLVGFRFKDGRIISVVDSSAAQNGLLTDHQLLEVNGQNVVGMRDKDVATLIKTGGSVATLTVMPSALFLKIMEEMAVDLVLSLMDHGVRTL